MPLSEDEYNKLIYGPTGKPAEPSARDTSRDMGMVEQVGRGVGQALLNIPETPLYYAEKLRRTIQPGFNIVPPGLRKWGRDFRNIAESSNAGVAGEVAGSLLSGSAEIGALSKIPQVAGLVSRFPRMGSTALGSVAGLWSRPAESPKEAAFQAGTGALAGGGIANIDRGIVSMLSHMPMSLKHIVARWLLSGGRTAPAGAIPGAAGNLAGQSVKDNQ